MNAFSFLKRGLRLGTWPLFQRYIVAPKISKQPPVPVRKNPVFCVHTLLNRKDIIMYEWMLRSLLRHSSRDFSVRVHEDGSFTNTDEKHLKDKFPGIEIVRKKHSDNVVYDALKDLPALTKYRKEHFWAIKAIDVYLLGTEKYMVLIDADVLFFQDPVELFSDDNRNFWMTDIAYMLGIPSALVQEKLGVGPLKAMNAGLGRAMRNAVKLPLAESFLNIQPIPANDMIFHAIFSTQHSSIELLDAEKYMLQFKLQTFGVIAKHYVNPVRFWFWEEGVPHVASQLQLSMHHFLKERL
jgi:hypothetical protein